MMEERAYPGVAVHARLIGIMEGEQTEEDGSKSRNDRLLAVAPASQDFANLTELKQAPHLLITQLEEFFANYHRIQHREFKSLGWKAREIAQRAIEQTIHPPASRVFASTVALGSSTHASG